jgi:L-lactate dehydrogenase (cytochrome)
MFFMDSGIQNGVNIASALAAGARLAFMGRAFAFGVSALGERGAYHTINLFYQQLEQVMNQLRCDSTEKMTNHLVK